MAARMRLAIAVLALVLALLAGGWLWLRSSSLVAVDEVTVTGAAGPDAEQIRSALTAAAHRMTTLDVSVARLRAAVAPYPVVGDLRAVAQFPHKLRIQVIDRKPVGTITEGGRAMPVSADYMLLHDVTPSTALPAITAAVAPAGSRIFDPTARAEVELLAAAPDQLIPRLTQASSDAAHGLTVQVRGGPSIYFGERSRLGAKWIAVSQVLADAGSRGAAYIDVTDPNRPAAGVGTGQPTSSATTATTTPTSPTTAATSTTGA
jgi:cell division protein FtsQ